MLLIKILLFILLGALALLLLAACLVSAVCFTLRVRFWDGDFSVSAGVWPVVIPVFPFKEGPPASKKQKARRASRQKAARKTQKQLQEKPEDLKGTFSTLKELAAAFFPPAGRALRHIRVRNLTVHIRVGGYDAAGTAIRYGEANALLYGSLGALSNLVDVKARHIGVSYDFLARETKVYFETDLRLRGGRILWGALAGLVGYLKIMMKKPVGEPAAEKPLERKG